MTVSITETSFLQIIFLICLTFVPLQAKLDSHYYDRTCSQVENIIFETVRNASNHDPKVPARILRMFFHDCFIRVSPLSVPRSNLFDVQYMTCFGLIYLKGCDASVLLDSTPENKAEKDGPPNISVRSFYVIDEAKAKLEAACPLSVSCADIIAIAARDVVTMVQYFSHDN